MTEGPDNPPGSPTPPPGRHRSAVSRNRNTIVILVVVVGIIIAATGLVLFDRAQTSSTQTAVGSAAAPPTTSQTAPITTGDSAAGAATTSTSAGDPDACPLTSGSVVVAVSPDLAPTLEPLADKNGRSPTTAGCHVVIKSVEPAEIAADGPAGADVWIPDSSMWIARATAAGIPEPAQHPSIATSPVVLAISGTAADQLAGMNVGKDVAGILATRQTASPLRVGLPDPQASATTIGAILAAKAAVGGKSDARAALTWALRSSPPGLPTNENELLDRLATDPGTVVPVSEQAVVAHNLAAGAVPAVAAYPATGGVALDYPVVPLGSDPTTVAVAGELTKWLESDPAREALLAAGFRAPDGSPGDPVSNGSGVDPAVRMTAAIPATQEVDDAIHSVEISNEPSRMLAVIDISGSMQAQVPGANGATRIDLAKAAASRGLALYSADSDIGLWVFSTNLAMGSDHRELIPVGTLGPDGQGGSGAQRLAQALSGITAINNGGTGLYDTTLDAVRTMRAGWDPSKVNAVLILSDGMNDDANSITLDSLLSTLTAEQDPSKPVPVISIAFGPDSDVNALNQISKATGGAAYQSQDPLQIGEIFLDAVGQRLCRPSC